MMHKPVTSFQPAAGDRLYKLTPDASRAMLRLTRLSDGAARRVCIRAPWRLGPPRDTDAWCASAWAQYEEDLISDHEWRLRLRAYERTWGKRPLLPYTIPRSA